LLSRVLVTGGAGYIGSHACKALHRVGFEPVAYDNLDLGHEHAVRWGPLERGDILDGARLREVMARVEPVAVLHFAALAYVRESLEAPARYYRTNITGTQQVLDAMRDAGVECVVYSSSCAVYGAPADQPITEQTRRRPINPYGESKLAAERMIAAYASAYGLRYVALRYFNVGGADPDGEIGEDHTPETHLLPLAIEAALEGRELPILGVDHDTPDGTCVRDFVHVSDLADAHVLALQHLLAGHDSDVFNLGAESPVSVREVIDEVGRITGHEVRTRELPRSVGDPPVLVAAARKAAEVLGFEPRRSDLETLVETAWRWHHRRRETAGR
jgi:UDP-arabinose 4-epimerase